MARLVALASLALSGFGLAAADSSALCDKISRDYSNFYDIGVAAFQNATNFCSAVDVQKVILLPTNDASADVIDCLRKDFNADLDTILWNYHRSMTPIQTFNSEMETDLQYFEEPGNYDFKSRAKLGFVDNSNNFTVSNEEQNCTAVRVMTNFTGAEYYEVDCLLIPPQSYELEISPVMAFPLNLEEVLTSDPSISEFAALALNNTKVLNVAATESAGVTVFALQNVSQYVNSFPSFRQPNADDVIENHVMKEARKYADIQGEESVETLFTSENSEDGVYTDLFVDCLKQFPQVTKVGDQYVEGYIGRRFLNGFVHVLDCPLVQPSYQTVDQVLLSRDEESYNEIAELAVANEVLEGALANREFNLTVFFPRNDTNFHVIQEWGQYEYDQYYFAYVLSEHIIYGEIVASKADFETRVYDSSILSDLNIVKIDSSVTVNGYVVEDPLYDVSSFSSFLGNGIVYPISEVMYPSYWRDQTVVDYLLENHIKLINLLDAANLTTSFTNNLYQYAEGWTVFAPSDDAIESFLAEQGIDLDNFDPDMKDTLEEFIQNHIVAGVYGDDHHGFNEETRLNNTNLTLVTVAGEELDIQAAMEVIIEPDNRVVNGFIHGLSDVLRQFVKIESSSSSFDSSSTSSSNSSSAIRNISSSSDTASSSSNDTASSSSNDTASSSSNDTASSSSNDTASTSSSDTASSSSSDTASSSSSDTASSSSSDVASSSSSSDMTSSSSSSSEMTSSSSSSSDMTNDMTSSSSSDEGDDEFSKAFNLGYGVVSLVTMVATTFLLA